MVPQIYSTSKNRKRVYQLFTVAYSLSSGRILMQYVGKSWRQKIPHYKNGILSFCLWTLNINIELLCWDPKLSHTSFPKLVKSICSLCTEIYIIIMTHKNTIMYIKIKLFLICTHIINPTGMMSRITDKTNTNPVK